jgi:hypothetical protein
MEGYTALTEFAFIEVYEENEENLSDMDVYATLNDSTTSNVFIDFRVEKKQGEDGMIKANVSEQ